jgi:hypothetical protein
MTWAWPRRQPRGLTQQDYDQMPRLAEFRAAHPGVTVEPGQFSTWEAVIPGPDSETFAARATLGELLDRLDELTGPET